MIREEIKNIKSGKHELRKFGFLIGIVLGLFGMVLLWRGRDYYTYFLIFSTGFVFFGLFLPVVLRPVYAAWMTLAVISGWFMTRVILGVLFYFVFTPIGLISRLSGKRFLDLKKDNACRTYWNYRETAETKKSGYEKQF